MKRLPAILLFFLSLAVSAQEITVGLPESPGTTVAVRPQEDIPFRTLYGKVTDTRTGIPVPYASVQLEGSGLSNITNAEGRFSLKIPDGTGGEAVVSIRHLGYLSASRLVSGFEGATAQRPLDIPLTPMSLQLDPAVIRDIDPWLLLQTAYRHVRDNYPQQHEHLTAFYREMIRKGTVKYLVLNEAVVDIDKAPYSNSFSGDRAAIYKGRGSKNFVASDTLFVKFQGGIAGSLAGDIVKDPFVGVSLELVPEYYRLSIEGSEILDGRECLILAFAEKDDEDPVLFNGRIFVDNQSYAIPRIEYAMNVRGREEKAAARFVVRKPADFKIGVDRALYSVNYKETGGLWHFDYSRMELGFTARRKHTLFRHSYTVISEMAVTDLSQEPFRISLQEKVKFNDILSDKVSDFSDPDFWGSYNVIEPDQSIETAIRRIIRQLKARN